MKSNQFDTMKYLSVSGVLLLLFMTGCDEEPELTAVDAANQNADGKILAPHALYNCGFATPLYGLATAPSGVILVADAGAGVAGPRGVTVIPLPGITGIAPLGLGSMWALTGAIGGTDGAKIDTGQGLHRVSKGRTRLIANLFAFEQANDPDGQGVDSNPFDVASLGGNAALVVDAGGNDLLRIDTRAM